MSECINMGTEFPKYYQFPEFLIRLPVSQTAKLVYMLLYDRARLSKKNQRIKNGCVYVNFTIKSMAEALGRSESTVKTAYRELDNLGLLIRRDGGFSKPNDLYVLIPDSGQFSDRIRKSSAVQAEKAPYSSQDSVPAAGRIPAPNKVIEQSNKSQNKRVNPRVSFGRYKNVYLSNDEYDQLKADYPDRIDIMIEEMSSYMAANGKGYQNHEAALRRWADRKYDSVITTGRKVKPGFEDYSFKEGESL